MKKYLKLALVALLAMSPSFAWAELSPAVANALAAYEAAPSEETLADLEAQILSEINASSDPVATANSITADLMAASPDSTAAQVATAAVNAAARSSTTTNVATVQTAVQNALRASGKLNGSTIASIVTNAPWPTSTGGGNDGGGGGGGGKKFDPVIQPPRPTTPGPSGAI